MVVGVDGKSVGKTKALVAKCKKRGYGFET